MTYTFPSTANFNVGIRYPGMVDNQQPEAWSSDFPYVQLNPDGTITASHIESGSASGGGSGYSAKYAKNSTGDWGLVEGSTEPVQWQYDDPVKALLKGAATLAAVYGVGTGLEGLFGQSLGAGAGFGGGGLTEPVASLELGGGGGLLGGGGAAVAGGATEPVSSLVLGGGGATGVGSTLLGGAKQVIDALGGAKTILPLLGGLGSYLDAKSQNGKQNGDPALLQNRANFQLGQLPQMPQFSTGLLGSPWGRY